METHSPAPQVSGLWVQKGAIEWQIVDGTPIQEAMELQAAVLDFVVALAGCLHRQRIRLLQQHNEFVVVLLAPCFLHPEVDLNQAFALDKQMQVIWTHLSEPEPGVLQPHPIRLNDVYAEVSEAVRNYSTQVQMLQK